jgi:hypothetical protein
LNFFYWPGCSAPLSLDGILGSLDTLLDFRLDLLSHGGGPVLGGGVVEGDTGDLDDTDNGEEEVDGSEAVYVTELAADPRRFRTGAIKHQKAL